MVPFYSTWMTLFNLILKFASILNVFSLNLSIQMARLTGRDMCFGSVDILRKP